MRYHPAPEERPVPHTQTGRSSGAACVTAVEVANESNNNKYDHENIKQPRINEIIEQVKKQERNGYRLLVSTSFNEGSIPPDRVVAASDYVLIHGNGV